MPIVRRRAAPARTPTIIEALDSPDLFAPAFAPAATWAAWRVALKALFALPMDASEAATYAMHTGRTAAPTSPAREGWFAVGRKGGKSAVAALVATYLACFRDWRPRLRWGERATVMVIAADRVQARVVFRYIVSLIAGVPALQAMVKGQPTAERTSLRNRVDIEIHTASFRAVRGYRIVAAVCDEIAFWRDESSANPDVEILNALRPGMALDAGAVLLCISSPYARRGAMWEAYRAHHGRDGDPVLVWQAPTAAMNPTVSEAVISAAYEADDAAASAEYGGLFRRDIESFVSREAVDACTVAGRRELAPIAGIKYVGFVDPSGGSADSMTLAVAHREPDGTAVLDALRERKPPFSPEAVVAEFAATVKLYKVTKVTGDRYGGEWPREVFRKAGIAYEPAAAPKSDLYLACLPAINSGKAALLDVPRLAAQLVSLERRTGRGKDVIDHSPGGHDDVANAAAGALVLAARPSRTILDDMHTPSILGPGPGSGAIPCSCGATRARPPFYCPACRETVMPPPPPPVPRRASDDERLWHSV